ncbi:MAG: YggU family protein [Candidatus Riflebacteria bacterium]|nr:YggU family protein [Candidatus Riflebacteria bacterium]
MPLPCIKSFSGGIILSVHVVPRSSKNEISELLGENCKIKIKAPPVDGKANKEIVEFLAKAFSVPKKAVIILGGESSKSKRIQINGLTAEKAEEILSAFFSV